MANNMKPSTRLATGAHVAGLLYLVAVVLGPFSLIYAPKVLVVTGNALGSSYVGSPQRVGGRRWTDADVYLTHPRASIA